MENAMSSISGAGGLNANILHQYLQSLNQTQQTGPSSGLAAVLQNQEDSDGSSQGVAGGKKSHHGASGAFLQSVQTAVSSALQTAQSGGTSAATPNQTVQSVFAQLLKNFQGSQSKGTSLASALGSDSDNGTDSSDSIGGSSTTNSLFAQMLQSNGVNAPQFQQNFLSAMQSAQNGGSTDPSTVFAGFPSGSLINTLG
jgi:hypothetical protein